MSKLHNQEKEQFKTLFKHELIDRFEDRFKILDVFLTTENHITVAELVDLLKESDIDLTPAFVEETLDLLSRYGFAKTNFFDNGKARYEHRHLGHHHDHMICGRCRKIIEFENDLLEDLQKQIAETYGFHLLQHKMEFYGICSDCLKETSLLKTLDMGRPGEKLVIKDFTGGKTAMMRLMSMGLRVNDPIEVITNNGHGQVVVALENKRYILGQGLAHKVLVRQTA